MITINSRFVELAASPVKTVRLLFDDGTDLTGTHDFQSSDYLMTATMTSLGAFLGVATKKMVAKSLGDWTTVKGHYFDAYLGIWDSTANAWNDINIGQFIVDNVAWDIDAGSSTITMYDALYVAGITPYGLNDSLFPITVKNLATALATTMGASVSFDAGLPNANYSITENLWKTINQATMKDVAQSIAEATGTTVKMVGDTLTFFKYHIGSEVITETNLKKFKIGGHWGEANSLVLSRMPQNDNIVLNNTDSVTAHGATAITIVNNQIVDDDRATLIQPIYDSLITTTPYIVQDDIESDTEGHGWYEVGDALTYTISGTDYHPIITEVNLTVAGSLKETIKSKIPTVQTINYNTAGGITKSIYNTEIKVDKQQNDITSIVSRQDITDQTVLDNYTEIQQDISNIQLSVQTTGGDNLLENSVGYALKTDGTIDLWAKTGTGTAVSQSSTGSLSYGGISGYEIDVSGVSAVLTQRISVTIGNPYSLSFRAKKNSTGSAKVKLSSTNDDFESNLNASTAYAWQEFKLENFIPTMNYLDVAVSSASADSFAITDLMVNNGERCSVWSQASNEVASENVIVNKNGITIKNSIYAGDFTQITPLEFAGYSNVSGSQAKVFSLNRDVTVVEKLQANSGITMTPIKLVPITSGNIQGLAFVKNI